MMAAMKTSIVHVSFPVLKRFEMPLFIIKKKSTQRYYNKYLENQLIKCLGKYKVKLSHIFHCMLSQFVESEWSSKRRLLVKFKFVVITIKKFHIVNMYLLLAIMRLAMHVQYFVARVSTQYSQCKKISMEQKDFHTLSKQYMFLQLYILRFQQENIRKLLKLSSHY